MSPASRLGRGLAATLLVACTPCGASAAGADPFEAIARTFAKSSVEKGAAVGVALGIVVGAQPPRFFSYGVADKDSGEPFGPDVAFEIGSVTKVFTTNLLGQAIYNERLSLSDPLSAFSRQLGSFKPLTAEVTLEQLGDFTAGLPSLAPLCTDPHPPLGCLPSDRPNTDVYNAQDFLKYFQNTVLKNYQDTPAKPITSLPAPYFYSDFSIGLVGLILGGEPNAPLSNKALHGWVNLLERRLLEPLGMRNTYLFPSASSRVSVARGYDQAVGEAVVVQGKVSEITVDVPGSGYGSAPPRVHIEGGGGVGAEATATVDDKGAVKAFTVTNGGHDYVAPPMVTFVPRSEVLGPASAAKAEVIVSDKKVVGIKILDRGSGYAEAPKVVLEGGRRNGLGRDAEGAAHIANGGVTFVSIDDGGDGYKPTVAVTVEPGLSFTSDIPIWAPAGALHSTIRDMTRFAVAALGQRRLGSIRVEPAITAGFKIAETPYACSGTNPDLTVCPADALLSDLGWATIAADQANNVPAIVLKNGGLPGFSTQILLMPARRLAVVAFVNSNGETDTGEKTGEAEAIARNVLYALYYELFQPGAAEK